ncbi:MAG TPA: ribonuclease III [Vicinamibacteria bacterium]|nr:ribonuclease III [Vicinamibacteria bacterium]
MRPIAADPSSFEETIGHRFRQPALMEQALTHKSFAHERNTRLHNESMEFLGDAVLGFVITDAIYREFSAYNEGRKSKIKAFLVSATTLAQLALELGLPRYLKLGKGEEKTGGRKKRALSANAFEALVAAVYLDAGLSAVRGFLEPLYAPLFEAIREGRAVVEDPKTVLQEYLQANALEPARYTVTAETGPEHLKTFHVELVVGSHVLSRADGPTKKKAELLAAKKAMAVLRRKEN